MKIRVFQLNNRWGAECERGRDFKYFSDGGGLWDALTRVQNLMKDAGEIFPDEVKVTVRQRGHKDVDFSVVSP